MKRDQAEMEAYYRHRAQEYDNVYLKPERQKDLKDMQSWLSEKFIGCSVLEIACGTGYWTQFMEHAADRIFAIDAAPEVLEIARERVRSESVEFHIGDAYSLNGYEGKYDASFSGFWFSHVLKENRYKFLSGLAGQLQDGARVVFIDNSFVQGNSTPISEKDTQGNTYQTRTLENGSKHIVLKNYPSETELLECIGGLGENPIFTQWQYYWALEYESIRP